MALLNPSETQQYLHKQYPNYDLIDFLGLEFQESRKYLQEDPSCQFRRRAFYRNTISIFDGHLNALKTSTYSNYFRRVKPTILLWEETFGIQFPENAFLKLVEHESVLLKLLDQKIDIDEKGKWKLKTDWLDTKANLRFTFRIISQIYGFPKGYINYGDGGWDTFQNALITRHRVTHPKMLDEILVSDEEMIELASASEWFLNAISKILEKVWPQNCFEQILGSMPPDVEKRVAFRQKFNAIFNQSTPDEPLIEPTEAKPAD